jgi:hypothetical protein
MVNQQVSVVQDDTYGSVDTCDHFFKVNSQVAERFYLSSLVSLLGIYHYLRLRRANKRGKYRFLLRAVKQHYERLTRSKGVNNE